MTEQKFICLYDYDRLNEFVFVSKCMIVFIYDMKLCIYLIFQIVKCTMQIWIGSVEELFRLEHSQSVPINFQYVLTCRTNSSMGIMDISFTAKGSNYRSFIYTVRSFCLYKWPIVRPFCLEADETYQYKMYLEWMAGHSNQYCVHSICIRTSHYNFIPTCWYDEQPEQ